MTFKEKTQAHINNEVKFAKLERYVELIEEKNKVMNLTGFTGDDLWKYGIYESIISLENGIEDHHGRLLDIGAGAGFPSVPYLIAHPQIELSIFEPLQKRTKFLEEVSKELELNIHLVITRAEEFAGENLFDYITARAVAPLKALVEISHKLSKKNGKFIWIKGPSYEEELEKSKKIFKKLSITPEVKKVNSEIDDKTTFLIIYSKTIETPQGIPRNWAQIVK